MFRASHLDGRVVEAGGRFWFDVHVFDTRDPALAYFVLAFAEMAREGVGPRRGRAALACVEQLGLDGAAGVRVFDGKVFLVQEAPGALAVELDGRESAERVRVRFVTPTELKSGSEVARRPEFGALFGRVRDRLSTLRALYGAGPLEVDFRGQGERAAAVRLARWDWRREEAERVSGKTGQAHPLGGFVGVAEYEGEVGEFLPYLRAGKWVGVGRQTAWGKGEVEIEELRN